jgi:hypothetical protein
MSVIANVNPIGAAAAKIGSYGRRLLSIPSEVAFRTLNPPAAAQRLPFLADFGLPRPRSIDCNRLDVTDVEIVETLEREGIYVTSLDALGVPGTGAMFDEATQLRNHLADRSRVDPQSNRNTLTATGGDLMRWDGVMRWALDERLLNIVEAYLGQQAAYDGPLLYLSKADGRENGIRVWHRDREDLRMIEIGIYLSDVDDAGGPFQILTPDLQKMVDQRNTWRHKVFKSANRAIQIRDGDWAIGVRSVTGARGTVILTDTARFHHRGSPPVDRDRAAIFHSFFPSRPRHPFCCERSSLSRRQITNFAATLPERQKSAMLWREKLPLLQRIIPRNRTGI